MIRIWGGTEALFVPHRCTRLTKYHSNKLRGDLSVPHSSCQVQDVWKYQTWKEITQIPAWYDGGAALILSGNSLLYLADLCSLKWVWSPLETGACSLFFSTLQTVRYQNTPSNFSSFTSEASFYLDEVTSWSELIIKMNMRRTNRMCHQIFQRLS